MTHVTFNGGKIWLHLSLNFSDYFRFLTFLPLQCTKRMARTNCSAQYGTDMKLIGEVAVH